jgi:hypothetical protein
MTDSINYQQMRTRYSLPKIARANLIWAACLLWGVLIAAGGSNPVSLVGVVSTAIAPLIGAWQAPAYLMPVWLVAHALILFLIIVAMRHVIWPTAWHKTEWALPIKPKQRLMADAVLVCAASLPIVVLYALGLGGFLWFAVPKANSSMIFGMAALLIASIATSLVAGIGYLHHLRKSVDESIVSVDFNGAKKQFVPLRWHRSAFTALVLSPIVSGTAPRTRQLWLASFVISIGILIGMARQPPVAVYWLAAFTVLLMTSAKLLRQWITIELSTLHDSAIHLPIEPKQLVLWRKWVVMSLIVICLMLLVGFSQVFLTPTLPALGLYVVLSLALCAYQIWHTPKANDVATLGWFVSVVTLMVVGSKVIA